MCLLFMYGAESEREFNSTKTKYIPNLHSKERATSTSTRHSLIPPHKRNRPAHLHLAHFFPNFPALYFPFPNYYRTIPLMPHRDPISFLVQTELSGQVTARWCDLDEGERTVVVNAEGGEGI